MEGDRIVEIADDIASGCSRIDSIPAVLISKQSRNRKHIVLRLDASTSSNSGSGSTKSNFRLTKRSPLTQSERGDAEPIRHLSLAAVLELVAKELEAEENSNGHGEFEAAIYNIDCTKSESSLGDDIWDESKHVRIKTETEWNECINKWDSSKAGRLIHAGKRSLTTALKHVGINSLSNNDINLRLLLGHEEHLVVVLVEQIQKLLALEHHLYEEIVPHQVVELFVSMLNSTTAYNLKSALMACLCTASTSSIVHAMTLINSSGNYGSGLDMLVRTALAHVEKKQAPRSGSASTFNVFEYSLFATISNLVSSSPIACRICICGNDSTPMQKKQSNLRSALPVSKTLKALTFGLVLCHNHQALGTIIQSLDYALNHGISKKEGLRSIVRWQFVVLFDGLQKVATMVMANVKRTGNSVSVHPLATSALSSCCVLAREEEGRNILASTENMKELASTMRKILHSIGIISPEAEVHHEDGLLNDGEEIQEVPVKLSEKSFALLDKLSLLVLGLALGLAQNSRESDFNVQNEDLVGRSAYNAEKRRQEGMGELVDFLALWMNDCSSRFLECSGECQENVLCAVQVLVTLPSLALRFLTFCGNSRSPNSVDSTAADNLESLKPKNHG